MAKVPVGKGGRGAGGALPEETRAILGATTNAGKAARSGLGGLLANAGDEARGFWQALQTPMGAANLATGFLGRFAVPAQVALEASRNPNALVESPETAIPMAFLRSQTQLPLFEQSPGWNQFAQGARQQVTETLAAPGNLLKPGGVGRISTRSAENLVKMLQGIRQGFYDAPVASTLGLAAPALQMASAHAPAASVADDAGMVAHHGTPHTFAPTEKNPLGEFDLSKMGSGEGAQEFGWGTYLAENPKIAEGYKKKMGHVYDVDVPDEHVANFLDWDVSGDAQPVALRRAYNEIYSKYNPAFDEHGNTTPVNYDRPIPDWLSGKEIYRRISIELGSDEAASRYLASKGVLGLKFLDQPSRGAGEGTRNLVIFDPSITTITARK